MITEKPMTTDAGEDAGDLRRDRAHRAVAPGHLQLSLRSGLHGLPPPDDGAARWAARCCVDFSWLLDTRHGADYFRRWHRERENSGGLLVHKATHHFDLVNWWIDSYPHEVFALARPGLLRAGERRGARRVATPYARYTGSEAARDDPFALFLDRSAALRGLYLEAEAESGYIRDRNVFGEPITIDDTMTVTARYRNGALLSYCLVAYAPWEGLRVAITGDRGRLEMDIVENVTHLMQDAERAAASKGAFKGARITVHPMFGATYEVEVPAGEGGHGGADPVMLEQLSRALPAARPVPPGGIPHRRGGLAPRGLRGQRVDPHRAAGAHWTISSGFPSDRRPGDRLLTRCARR